ncbi:MULTISPECIES: ABC transporter ATP-binding protein [unclassified Streptomyces]|uniref:ABC transporter ATP-binding protein n=1 Tax=unclassified Streptomyces TaxID=2593676 RepID=UPI002E2DB577|nr:ABC transporter ATP-binding protein [Streptomyces sp. NBC_00223]
MRFSKPRPADAAAEPAAEIAATDILVPDPAVADPHTRTLAGASLRSIAARAPADLALTFRLAWRVDRRALVGVTCAELASAAATGLGLLATADALTPLLSADGHWHAAIGRAAPALITLLAAGCVRSVLQAVITALTARLGPRVDNHAAQVLLETITRSELIAYEDPAWENAKTAAEDGARRGHQLVQAALDTAAATLRLTAAALVLATLSWVLVPLLLLAVVPNGAAGLIAARVAHRSARKTAAARRWRAGLMTELTYRDAAAEVRVHSMSAFLMARYRAATDKLEQEAARVGRATARVHLTGQAAAGIGTTAVYATLVYLTARGSLAPGTAAGVAVVIRTAGAALADTVTAAGTLFEHGLYVADWATFTTREPAPSAVRGFLPLPEDWTSVHLDSVTFTYPQAASPALDHVTLTLNRGEVIALVGENGSGKTTLSKIIAGLLLPASGTVTWHGPSGPVSVADLDPEGLWRHVTVVAQNTYDWPLTVRDSITLGRHHGGDEAIHAAAAQSGADAVIAGLPHGLDTSLARSFWGGHDLSAGQWQRLALARAFLRDTALLLMDEPTSALDARGEHLLFSRLRALAAGRTVVLITHRLANICDVDRVIVLEHGRVREHGGFGELLTTPGSLLGELHALQNSRGDSPPPQAGPVEADPEPVR